MIGDRRDRLETWENGMSDEEDSNLPRKTSSFWKGGDL